MRMQILSVCVFIYIVLLGVYCGILCDSTASDYICKMLREILIGTLLASVLYTGRTSAMMNQPKLTFTEITCDLTPNKYIDQCKGWVENGYAFLNISLLGTLSPDLIIWYSISFGDTALPPREITVCDAFEDEVIGKEIGRFGYPKETFPEGCSTSKEGTYEFRQYFLAPEKIPPYSTNGQMVVDIHIAEDDEEPFVRIYVAGNISNIATSTFHGK